MFDLLVLDAMGVIYAAKDDVAELLAPFVSRHGGASAEVVEHCYHSTSLGLLDPDEFWKRVGLSPDLEDDYLETHIITPGLLDFLQQVTDAGISIAALTNDVDRWSRKLRQRFGLERWIANWVVSSRERVRKPDPLIYDALTRAIPEATTTGILFVDDRRKNLDTAVQKGWQTVLFRSESDVDGDPQRKAENYAALWNLICREKNRITDNL